jgi:hypothetical protein
LAGGSSRIAYSRRSLPLVSSRRTGAPYLARFSLDVGFHVSFPRTLDSPDGLGGQRRWYPISREKRARYGAPGLREGTRDFDSQDVLVCHLRLLEQPSLPAWLRVLEGVCPVLFGPCTSFSRDVGFHVSFPWSLDSPDGLSGQRRWYPISREKRARYGPPVLREGTRDFDLQDVLVCHLRLLDCENSFKCSRSASLSNRLYPHG